MDEATFQELARHFSAGEIIELSYNATSYYASGLFMKALAIEPDEVGKVAAPGKFSFRHCERSEAIQTRMLVIAIHSTV